MFNQFILIILQLLTLYSPVHLKLPFSSIVSQALSKIMDIALRQSIRIRKSTKLLNFIYSCYSSSFTLFLASIHCLSEASSYKEVIFLFYLAASCGRGTFCFTQDRYLGFGSSTS